MQGKFHRQSGDELGWVTTRAVNRLTIRAGGPSDCDRAEALSIPDKLLHLGAPNPVSGIQVQVLPAIPFYVAVTWVLSLILVGDASVSKQPAWLEHQQLSA